MLKIEAGKYYETADGVRVGPMFNWADADGVKIDVAHPWQQGSEEKATTLFDKGGDLWRDDGSSGWCPDLVREVP